MNRSGDRSQRLPDVWLLMAGLCAFFFRHYNFEGRQSLYLEGRVSIAGCFGGGCGWRFRIWKEKAVLLIALLFTADLIIILPFRLLSFSL